MYAVVVVRNSLFVGPAHAVFKSVMNAWKRIYGDLPAAGLTGNALIAAP
jgi:hypothetical protein